VKLLLKTFVIKSRHGMKQLHSDSFTIFMHSLLNITYKLGLMQVYNM
jgi:hypothetical protein